jgi:hypothetical protein
MFRVLDDSFARNLGNHTTLTMVLKLAHQLKQSGQSANTETYEYILSAYAKGGQDKFAVLHKEMLALGIQPSRTFYHKALQVQCDRETKLSIYINMFV